MPNGGTTLNPQINRERWTQLTAGVICMIMIANLQYGWPEIAQVHAVKGAIVAKTSPQIICP